ncbi:hypothetical protein ATZ99_04340 [Thermovenabulum gondwanense]|uniref:Uncharacterized protein n=1 Tax=Thermovenabulum gondwanense TaxID=520767 RepID=A0A162MV56_9FIRM|nr:hypothetical protein ATZ99_04340 [Thermovenabulum gondwanense]
MANANFSVQKKSFSEKSCTENYIISMKRLDL